MKTSGDPRGTPQQHAGLDGVAMLEAIGLGDRAPVASGESTARDRWLYRGLDLVVPRGRVIAVIGANGAGKSTLLRRLAGLEGPHEGEVRWRPSPDAVGEPVLSMAPRQRARHIAYLPQYTSVPDDLWVRDVVALGRVPHLGVWGRRRPEDRAAIEEALTTMGLRSLASRPLASLSGGERQRVLVARLLAVGAPVWLLDEPTTALDVSWSSELHATFRQMASAGHSVIIAMHGIEAVTDVADDVLILGAGVHASSEDTASDEGGRGRAPLDRAPHHVFGPAATTLDPEHLRRAFGIEFEATMVLRPRSTRS